MTPGDEGRTDDPTREPPPERVKSTPGPAGPVPVRDLMKRMTPEPEAAPGAEADPRWDRMERTFQAGDETWVVRSAGAGAYGTGRLGTARLVAVHFFRESAPDAPVREALLPAGVFPDLGATELRELFDRATPIDLER